MSLRAGTEGTAKSAGRRVSSPRATQAGSGPQHDPRVRRDGKCANGCGKNRVVFSKSQHKYATEGDFAKDPFCSRECCEKWHGID